MVTVVLGGKAGESAVSARSPEKVIVLAPLLMALARAEPVETLAPVEAPPVTVPVIVPLLMSDPPEFTVTLPLIVPPPSTWSVLPLWMVTLLVMEPVLQISSVPAVTVVAPV